MKRIFGFRIGSDGVPQWTPKAHIADLQKLQKSDGFDVVVGSDGLVDRPQRGEKLIDVINRNREE